VKVWHFRRDAVYYLLRGCACASTSRQHRCRAPRVPEAGFRGQSSLCPGCAGAVGSSRRLAASSSSSFSKFCNEDEDDDENEDAWLQITFVAIRIIAPFWRPSGAVRSRTVLPRRPVSAHLPGRPGGPFYVESSPDSSFPAGEPPPPTRTPTRTLKSCPISGDSRVRVGVRVRVVGPSTVGWACIRDSPLGAKPADHRLLITGPLWEMEKTNCRL
jgi:hypothetical protein